MQTVGLSWLHSRDSIHGEARECAAKRLPPGARAEDGVLAFRAGVAADESISITRLLARVYEEAG